MKHIKRFNERVLTYLDQDVNIRFDIETIRNFRKGDHTLSRQKFRSGEFVNIEDGDIIDVVERAIEELTIALMRGSLKVREAFVLKDAYSDLNIVAVIEPSSNEFKLRIITVMNVDNFKVRDNQYVLEI